MISAYEAKVLAEDSQAEVEKVIDLIDPLIRAAGKGERSLKYFGKRCHWRNDDLDARKRNEEFVRQVMHVLQKKGFSGGLAHEDRKYTVGMDDDTEYWNVYLLIRW